jgi:hypothetical protein
VKLTFSISLDAAIRLLAMCAGVKKQGHEQFLISISKPRMTATIPMAS